VSPTRLHIRSVERLARRLLLLSTLLAGASSAQVVRDPTIAPAAASPAALAAGAIQTDYGPLTVIVRDGQSFLVVGSRLYKQGDKVGEARIERIGETEIWLREGQSLRKLARYPGVLRLQPARHADRAACASATTNTRNNKAGAGRAADDCAKAKP